MALGFHRLGDAPDKVELDVACPGLNTEGGVAALRQFPRFAGPGLLPVALLSMANSHARPGRAQD